jgi:hypothetical protein
MATEPRSDQKPHKHVCGHIDTPNSECGSRIHTHRGGGKAAGSGAYVGGRMHAERGHLLAQQREYGARAQR